MGSRCCRDARTVVSIDEVIVSNEEESEETKSMRERLYIEAIEKSEKIHPRLNYAIISIDLKGICCCEIRGYDIDVDGEEGTAEDNKALFDYVGWSADKAKFSIEIQNPQKMVRVTSNEEEKPNEEEMLIVINEKRRVMCVKSN